MAREQAEIVRLTSDHLAAYSQARFGSIPEGGFPRLRGFAGVVGERVVAVGGIAFWPDGTRQAFCDLSPEARLYPKTMHRAALMTIEMARQLGIRRIVATSGDDGVEPARADRWLLRLGFNPCVIADKTVYVLNP